MVDAKKEFTNYLHCLFRETNNVIFTESTDKKWKIKKENYVFAFNLHNDGFLLHVLVAENKNNRKSSGSLYKYKYNKWKEVLRHVNYLYSNKKSELGSI